MNKKKNNNIFLKILGFLFIIYMALFIANISGYYEGKVKDKVTITEEGIKEFEEKVANNEEIDITSFLSNEKKDYNNNISKLGDNITYGIESVVFKGMKLVKSIVKSLF